MGGGAFVAPLACAVLCLRRSNTSAAQPCRKHSRENCTPISSGSTSKAFQRTFFRRTLLPRCLGQLLLLGKVRLIPCTHTAHTARWPAAFSSVDRVYVRVYVPGCHAMPWGRRQGAPCGTTGCPLQGPPARQQSRPHCAEVVGHGPALAVCLRGSEQPGQLFAGAGEQRAASSVPSRQPHVRGCTVGLSPSVLAAPYAATQLLSPMPLQLCVGFALKLVAMICAMICRVTVFCRLQHGPLL